ncbi:helix-turn-helix domain-containing protein [Streptomyces zagrosensis]|uniref:Excisionase family DNA binding protein n=1 Tax=Streptomyces zagrosensis TaxID=1042984 RepID=A0A7W9QGX4_9ACTN|nr:helix-turn-helix domain-containing protein [Streptomyces zagrosensis]MBB5938812.1 excisionase family DNA binding protein [Streptomyces zagrosensis]
MLDSRWAAAQQASLGGGLTDRLMTMNEVAAYLGKPPSWVYGNWRRLEIPFRKVGQALRCRPTDLEKWLDQQTD